MLEARGLTKWYGSVLALKDVSFDVRPGEILGYLGPNGSGKSTTIGLVVGLLQPSAGSVLLDGVSLNDQPVEFKRRLGYVPEQPYLYPHLTAHEYLMLVGRLRGIRARLVEEKSQLLLRLFSLEASRYTTISSFSKGMRQRVLLSAALLHDPALLVVDEPFSGLDVSAALLFRTLLEQFAAAGGMVLFSSHRFELVARVCSRALILSQGRVAACHEIGVDAAGSASAALEAVFARATDQENYAELARDILQVARLA